MDQTLREAPRSRRVTYFSVAFFTCAAAGLVLACGAGAATAAIAGDGADGGGGPSNIVALRITASGTVVVKPGLLVNCAAYHCGGRYHFESPDEVK